MLQYSNCLQFQELCHLSLVETYCTYAIKIVSFVISTKQARHRGENAEEFFDQFSMDNSTGCVERKRYELITSVEQQFKRGNNEENVESNYDD